MAFALAVEAAQLFLEAGKVMLTCTFIVILITVLINGGSTAYLLDWCQLAQGPRAHQAAAIDAAASAGIQQQQQYTEAGQHLQQQGDRESECEQVQLLLHEKLRGKLQERGRMQAAEQAAAVATGQPDDYKIAASRDAATQQPGKQQGSTTATRPVLVVDASAEGISEDRGSQHGMISLDGAAGTAAAAACAAPVASPAMLVDEGDSAVTHQQGNLRRRSSGNGSAAAAAGEENDSLVEHYRLAANVLIVALPNNAGLCVHANMSLVVLTASCIVWQCST
jgi:hypothetical protein